jgi:alanine racemase
VLLAIERAVPDTDELLPVTATVDLSALRHNIRVLQERAGRADLMAIVKADAYGHGAVPVARTLRDEGVQHFAVARPAEGVRLREAGLTGRILVLGAPIRDQLSVYASHDLDVTVSSPAVAAAACEHGRPSSPLRAHVKVDTGMGRIGLSADEVPAAVARLTEAPGVTLAGIWTHFATADEPESAFAQAQLDRFEAVLDAADLSRPFTGHVHTANTGALLTIGARAHDFSAPLVRTGIALYGLAASADLHTRIDLRPVMTLSARVTHLKTVEPGTPISYGARWRAPRTTRIATLGVGYGDGYPRLCSGRATVRIAGAERPVVGTICMDMCMVDLGPPDQSPAADVAVGDDATLFGPSGPTLYDVAEWAETIPYEICCGISPRVPREYTGPAADQYGPDAPARASTPHAHP